MKCLNCGKELNSRRWKYCSTKCNTKFVNTAMIKEDQKRLLIFNNMTDKEQLKEMMKFTNEVMKNGR